eukprot:366571-Chlamydomonas_euryale.AAC.2
MHTNGSGAHKKKRVEEGLVSSDDVDEEPARRTRGVLVRRSHAGDRDARARRDTNGRNAAAAADAAVTGVGDGECPLRADMHLNGILPIGSAVSRVVRLLCAQEPDRLSSVPDDPDAQGLRQAWPRPTTPCVSPAVRGGSIRSRVRKWASTFRTKNCRT